MYAYIRTHYGDNVDRHDWRWLQALGLSLSVRWGLMWWVSRKAPSLADLRTSLLMSSPCRCPASTPTPPSPLPGMLLPCRSFWLSSHFPGSNGFPEEAEPIWGPPQREKLWGSTLTHTLSHTHTKAYMCTKTW